MTSNQLQVIVNGKVKNTFKFGTIIFLILGLIVPLWPISLPLFWFLAYGSYKSGKPFQQDMPIQSVTAVTELDELKKLKALFDSKAITEEEFNIKKAQLLARKS